VTVAVTADPPADSVKDVAVIVDGSIAREKVAVTTAVAAIPVAPSAGAVPVTVGGAGGLAHVVNDHDTAFESGTPSDAVIAVVSRAVYVVDRASCAEGVNVAVWVVSSYATLAVTAPPGPVSVKLAVVSVVGSRERENTALIGDAGLKPVAASAGVVDATVSGTAAAVVNDQLVALARGVPSDAFAAVETVAVYVVPKSS
jgi:hypothetical protein